MAQNPSVKDKFYSTLSQLGASFIGPDGGNKKIRSLGSEFGIFMEECYYKEKRLVINCTLMNFSGCQSTLLDENVYDGKPDYLHQHDYFEMMMVLDGMVKVQIETGLYQYQKGDAYLINRAVKHIELFDCDCSVAFLCISKEAAYTLMEDLAVYQNCKEFISFFKPNLEEANGYKKDFLEFRTKIFKDTIAERISSESLVEQIIQNLSLRCPGYTYMVHGLLVQLFCNLAKPEEYKFQAYHLEFTLSDYIFEQICSYIAITGGKIIRKDLEKELHYSGDYLNKIVKRHTGMTLIEFSQSYRMREVARRICNSDISIVKISQELGFENKAYFYRLFEKIYHMTPTAYREFRNRKQRRSSFSDPNHIAKSQ